MTKSETTEPDDTETLREIGRLLTRAVAERGMTDRKLAHAAGVSRTNIRYAKNGANITLLTLLKLTRALGIHSMNVGGLLLGDTPAGDDSAIAEELRQAIAHLAKAVALIESKPARAAPATSDDADAKAAALIRDVVATAKTLGSGRLNVLEGTLRGLATHAADPVAKSATRRPKERGKTR